jgi:hypothetical protein
MSNQLYRREAFVVIPVANGFIVHNTAKDFKAGHTHLKSFSVARNLIELCLQHKMPKTRNHYLIDSLVRISDSPDYKMQLLELLDTRRQKGPKPACHRRAV